MQTQTHCTLLTNKRIAAFGLLLAIVFVQSVNADQHLNRVPNPEFIGDQGNTLGTVAGTVPNFWRAFAVGGGDVSIEIVPLAANALYVGSPATNAVKLTVNTFGTDQGFDHEGSYFSLTSGHSYSADVYMKTGNSDDSPQQVSIALPVFDANGFTGRQPGSFATTVTSQWASYSGPSFMEADGTAADVAFRLIDDLGENSLLIAIPTVDGPDTGQQDISYPPIFTTGRDFSSTDKFVSTMVFHWYSVISGQSDGPWRPFEGRAAWSGEVPFWRDQIKDIMDANIDVMYVHLFNGFDYSREQLFEALSQLRREGYETPYVLPFLDPLIIWNQSPIDLAQAGAKDEYVGWYIRWFEQYFRNNPDAAAESHLLHIDGKVVLNTWHNNPGSVENIASLSRSDVESRLNTAYGTQYPSFQNGVYQIGTANGFAPVYADEIGHQFSNTAYFSTNTFAGKRPATMKAGYWDQNIRTPGLFLARNGGTDFDTGWGQLNADNQSPTIYHVYVESWNEYDEGTGIYAGDTGPPLIAPMNTSGNTDTWSATNNPRQYIDSTNAGAAVFNDTPDLDSLVLWHNLPATMEPGASAGVSILIRNTGDTKWSDGAGIELAQSGMDNHTWGPTTVGIDAVDNEVGKYGGVFRGRPVLFEFTITAPLTSGDYSANYQMQESAGGGNGFGDVLSVNISVTIDTDGDGVPDDMDAFPNDPNESVDTDGDGIGNNADLDDDGDGVPDTQDAYPLGQFTDAPSGSFAFSFIEALARAGITSGCGGGNYCPLAPVTRAQMAVFLERGMNGSGFSPPAASGNVFLDVGAGDFAASFIEQLASDGITAGCGNNNYCPDTDVTRDQMAVFLLRAKHGSSYSPPAATGIFSDVPLSYWAVHWIEQLAAEGITAGCGGGNYCPENPVTRAQMAVFLVRTFGL